VAIREHIDDRTGRDVVHRVPSRVSLSSLSDEALIGHPDRDAALEAIFERYHPLLRRYCRIRVSDPHDAEDLAAQAMTKAVAAFPPKGHMNLRAWLVRIAQTTTIDFIRSRTRHSAHSPLGHDVGDATYDPGRIDHFDDLYAALAHLPDDQRRVIELRMTGLKGREIAEVMNRTHDSIRMLQVRAMKDLRKHLAPEDDR
jgi:RNA polymerase sigma-70 factor (ECF subfamily)